jgi:hypothetical protein
VKFGFGTSGVATEPYSYQRIFRREEISSADTVRGDGKPILFVCGVRRQDKPLHIVNLTDLLEGDQTQGGRLPPTDGTCATLLGGSATLAKVPYSVAIRGDTIGTITRVPPPVAEGPVICQSAHKWKVGGGGLRVVEVRGKEGDDMFTKPESFEMCPHEIYEIEIRTGTAVTQIHTYTCHCDGRVVLIRYSVV